MTPPYRKEVLHILRTRHGFQGAVGLVGPTFEFIEPLALSFGAKGLSAMRDAFFEELIALKTVNPPIALTVDDLGYSVVGPFADRFPNRFIDAGAAEQNMTGLAAGMASEGYHAFLFYSIPNFPTFRYAEQNRNDIDYRRLPVTVVAVGGGLRCGAFGYPHHVGQDYAQMRCMPNMLIAALGDPMEVRACMRHMVEQDSLAEEEHVERAVCSLALWRMADKPTRAQVLRAHDEVVTLEDHRQQATLNRAGQATALSVPAAP